MEMFIQIEKNHDGSHAFQHGGTLQEGWAYWDTDAVPLPESFPWVDIVVEDVTHPEIKDEENGKVLEAEYKQLEVVSAAACEISGKEPDNRLFEEIQIEKLSSLSETCNQTIVAGMDVETTEGIEHFSLEETDQINLTTALSAIEQGAKGYPYHADKKLCRMFTAVELKAIAKKATAHKLYHTTLCNHLLILARRATTTAELDKITYSADCLPPDLAENMKKVLTAAGY